MQLSAKLDSLTKENVVSELNHLLEQSKVRISYTGQRLLKIQGYEGEVSINQFAKTFFKASAFYPEQSPSLETRLACDDLWTKIQNLYAKSDKKLNKSASLLQTFTHFREFRPYCRSCAGDPQAVIGEWDFGGRRSSIFEFKPEEFKVYFGDAAKVGSSWSSRGEFWLASRKMVENVMQEHANTQALRP